MSADKATDDKPKKPKKVKGARLVGDVTIAYVAVSQKPVSKATVG